MYASDSFPQRVMVIVRVVALLVTIAVFGAAKAEEATTQEEKRVGMITEYIAYQGLNPPVPVEYGRQLIPDLIRLLKAEQKLPDLEKVIDLRERKTTILQGLLRAIREFEGYEEAKLGRKLVYELMKSPDLELRRRAMSGAAYLDRESGTNAWLGTLNDPDESTRVHAACLLGAFATPSAVTEIERILEERTRKVIEGRVAKDNSLKWMQAAIAEIKDRANGTPWFKRL